MKKITIILSLLMATHAFAQGFNCKGKLERDIQIRTNKVNSSIFGTFGRKIKKCIKEKEDRLLNCGLGLGVPSFLAAFSFVPSGFIIVPSFIALTKALDLSNTDDHDITMLSHKRQLRLSKLLYSVLSGNRKDIWELKLYQPYFRHATNDEVLNIVQEMDANGTLCQERGQFEESLKISEAGMRELERKSLEVGKKLTWFDLMNFDGIEGELSKVYISYFISRYTIYDRVPFGEVVSRKDFKKKLKEELRSLGYYPKYKRNN